MSQSVCSYVAIVLWIVILYLWFWNILKTKKTVYSSPVQKYNWAEHNVYATSMYECLYVWDSMYDKLFVNLNNVVCLR